MPTVDREPWWLSANVGIFTGALLLIAGPSYFDLSQTIWAQEEQSHGPVILALALWLLWRKRELLQPLPQGKTTHAGWVLLALSALGYAIGRSQAVAQVEVLSVIGFLASACVIVFGLRSLRVLWFPLFLLLFTVPLPGVLVQTLTIPLKSAVSYFAELLLYHLGYPIARTGVILSVGQYQLLVADACAGLTSIFTLEAMGLAYMQLMKYTSRTRNILLAVLVIPCAFIANVVRVIVLVLVTYYFGNEAGEGFVHTFAGLLLFIVALAALLAADRVLDLFPNLREPPAHATPVLVR